MLTIQIRQTNHDRKEILVNALLTTAKRLSIMALVLCALCSCNQRKGESDSWDVTDVSNAIDGQAFKAVRIFEAPEANSRLEVAITCVTKSKDLRLDISSYSASPNKSGNYDGNAFVSDDAGKPAGRIKLGEQDPTELAHYFSFADYNNVVAWKIHELDLAPDGTILAVNPDPGTTLLKRLPAELEVRNTGGAIHFEIPAGNPNINSVVEKCIDRRPATISGSEASTSPPASHDADSAADISGHYHRSTPAVADMTVTKSASGWHVELSGAAPPNGGSTAADCTIVAEGPLDGGSLQGNLVPFQSEDMTISADDLKSNPGRVIIRFANGSAIVDQATVSPYCGMGSDLTGTYEKPQ